MRTVVNMETLGLDRNTMHYRTIKNKTPINIYGPSIPFYGPNINSEYPDQRPLARH